MARVGNSYRFKFFQSYCICYSDQESLLLLLQKDYNLLKAQMMTSKIFKSKYIHSFRHNAIDGVNITLYARGNQKIHATHFNALLQGSEPTVSLKYAYI